MNLVNQGEDSSDNERLEDESRVNSNNGKWNQKQHAKYVVFIEKNR